MAADRLTIDPNDDIARQALRDFGARCVGHSAAGSNYVSIFAHA